MRFQYRMSAFLVGLLAVLVFASPIVASEGAQPWRDTGCFVQGDYKSCWEAQGVSQFTSTPSGKTIWVYQSVNKWTYGNVVGDVFGTSHGTYHWIENDVGVTVMHRVQTNAVRFGALSCRTTLNVQVIDGQVRHSVDLGPCVPS